MKLKYFLSLVGIDIVFLFSLYFFFLFIVTKIQTLMAGFQNYTDQLGGIENVMMTNMSNIDFTQLNTVTESMKGLLSTVLFYFFLGALGAFVLFCLSQGINWSLAYNLLKNKFKIDKTYILRFIISSLFIVSLGVFLFYRLLASARFLFLGKLLNETFSNSDLFKMISYGILLILLIYFAFVFYTLLNKYKFSEIFKHILENLKLKSFLIFLGGLFGILLIIYLFLQLQIYSLGVYLVEVVLISVIIEKFRVYLLRIL